jgi:predicted O-methyltransferase YrrM
VLSKAKDSARVLAKRLVGVQNDPVYADMGEHFHQQYVQISRFTMTSIERMYAMHEAARYIVRAAIPGDVVECGVWRGGSSMMAAMTLTEEGDQRRLWLYDTFEGMPPPDDRDTRWDGEPAAEKLARLQAEGGADARWAYASLETVRENMARTGYPDQLVRYVPGKVEETIPAQAPETIALLRLDTDWYESTLHELEHLWDRLSVGGILILDDYGHWQGAREATDEFFAKREIPAFLHRIDYSGRLAIKLR